MNKIICNILAILKSKLIFVALVNRIKGICLEGKFDYERNIRYIEKYIIIPQVRVIKLGALDCALH